MKKILLIITFMLTTAMDGQSFVEQKDKHLHFAAGNIAGLVGYTTSYQKHEDKTRALITGICTAFAAGVAKEFYDAATGGYVELADVAATTLGGITIGFTIPLFEVKKPKLRTNKRKRRPKSNKKCYKP